MEAGSCAASWGGLEELEPELRGYLGRRCRDESEVDDVLQETLLRAARYRTTLTDPGRLRGWAFRIAMNVLRDHVRRERRLRRGESSDEALDLVEGRETPPGVEPDELELALGARTVGREELLAAIERALGQVAADDRRVLRSFYAGGGSCSRTGIECGIPRPLVKVRLFRARRRLGRAVRRLLVRGGSCA